MDNLQYVVDAFGLTNYFNSFKPCYKWIIFNITASFGGQDCQMMF